jgi:hypothetical protein
MKFEQLSGVAATALVAAVLSWASTAPASAGVLSIGDCTGSASCAPVLIPGFVTNPATTPGSASVTGFVTGIWTITASGTGSPPLSPPTQLESNTITVSSAGPGTIIVVVTEQGNTTPLGPTLYNSGFTANSLSGTFSVTEMTLNDPGNGLFSTAALNPADVLSSNTFTGPISTAEGANASATSLADASPFSVTTEYLITTTGAGSGNLTVTLASVPAPLIGYGLLVVLAVGGVLFGGTWRVSRSIICTQHDATSNWRVPGMKPGTGLVKPGHDRSTKTSVCGSTLESTWS